MSVKSKVSHRPLEKTLQGAMASSIATMWEIWGVALIVLIAAFAYCQRSAALRGCNREPLPQTQDKLLRLLFFWWIVSPMCFVFGWNFAVLCLIYLPSYLDGSEKSGTRDDQWMRSARLWGLFKSRMNLKLVRSVKLNPQQQYIIGLHPHGILPWGACVNMLTTQRNAQEMLNGVDMRFLAASFAFYIPLYRDLLLFCGGLDAARYNAISALDRGHSLMLVPGGATEALYSYPGTNTLYLRNRKGFVKLALETGSSLLPVYSFNETDAYGQISDSIPLVKSFKRQFQRIFGISLPLITNIIPRPCHVTTVTSVPIPVPKVDEPSDELVQEYLDKYIVALEKLFAENAEKYGSENNLVIL